MEDWTDMDNLATMNRSTFFSSNFCTFRKLPTFHQAEGKVGLTVETLEQNEQDELR